MRSVTLLARLSVHNVTCVEAILDTSELALDDLALGDPGSTALGFNSSARFFAQLLSLPSWTDSSFKGPVGEEVKPLAAIQNTFSKWWTSLRELFLLQTFTKTHAQTTPILVDEFDAGRFESRSYFLRRLNSPTQHPVLCFQTLYRRH